MSTGFAEGGGFETQTPPEVQQRPDLRLLPQVEDDEEDITQETAAVQVTAADFFEAIEKNTDREVLSQLIDTLPRVLELGVITGGLPPDQLDRIRDVWGRLMAHGDDDISYEAQETYTLQNIAAKPVDAVTAQRIGWLVNKELFD